MTIIPYAFLNNEWALVFCFYSLFLSLFCRMGSISFCPEYKIRKRKTLSFNILFLFLIPYSLFDRIDSIPYLPKISNRILFQFLIPYSLFDRIDSSSYLTTIRNKEWNNVFVPYFLFYKIDVTLERRCGADYHFRSRSSWLF